MSWINILWACAARAAKINPRESNDFFMFNCTFAGKLIQLPCNSKTIYTKLSKVCPAFCPKLGCPSLSYCWFWLKSYWKTAVGNIKLLLFCVAWLLGWGWLHWVWFFFNGTTWTAIYFTICYISTTKPFTSKFSFWLLSCSFCFMFKSSAQICRQSFILSWWRWCWGCA